jgi:hypothetical protein
MNDSIGFAVKVITFSSRSIVFFDENEFTLEQEHSNTTKARILNFIKKTFNGDYSL